MMELSYSLLALPQARIDQCFIPSVVKQISTGIGKGLTHYVATLPRTTAIVILNKVGMLDVLRSILAFTHQYF